MHFSMSVTKHVYFQVFILQRSLRYGHRSGLLHSNRVLGVTLVTLRLLVRDGGGSLGRGGGARRGRRHGRSVSGHCYSRGGSCVRSPCYFWLEVEKFLIMPKFKSRSALSSKNVDEEIAFTVILAQRIHQLYATLCIRITVMQNQT